MTNSMNSALDRDYWRALLSTVLDLWVLYVVEREIEKFPILKLFS